MDGVKSNFLLNDSVQRIIDLVEDAESHGDGPFLALLTSAALPVTRGAMSWSGELVNYHAAFKGYATKPITHEDFTTIADDTIGKYTTLPNQTWQYDSEESGNSSEVIGGVALVADPDGAGNRVLIFWPLDAPKTFGADGDLLTVAIKHREQNPPWPEPEE